jgi:hypothetical protein
MYKKIEISHLSAGSVYKLLAIGTLCSIVPFCTLMGVLALSGSHTLSWNDQPVTGISGLLAGPFIGAFIGGCFVALWGTVVVLGLWIYSKLFSYTIAVHEVPADSCSNAHNDWQPGVNS